MPNLRSNASSIVYVEQFFCPEVWSGAQITRDIVYELRAKIGMIKVLCGSCNFIYAVGKSKLPHSTLNDIDLCPLFVFGSKRQPFLRLLDQLLFSVQAFIYLLFSKKASLIVVQTNPPPIVIAAALASVIKKIPLLIIAMDLYPDALFAVFPTFKQTLIGRILIALYNYSYTRAQVVVSLGPAMTDKLREKRVSSARIIEIPNWATGDLSLCQDSENKTAEDWGVVDGFNLLYSGNLGLAHELDTIMYALSRLGDDCPNLRLIVVSTGSRLKASMQLASNLHLNHRCLFKPLVPISDLPQTMGLAQMALVSIRSEFAGIVVPSKLAGFMARGLPIIYIGPPSGVSDSIEFSSSGSSFRNGDIESVSSFLRKVYYNRTLLLDFSRSSLSFYRSNWDSSIGLHKYSSTVKNILDAQLSNGTL